MRVLVQRVTEASVVVAGEVVEEVTRPGLLVLVGVARTDTGADADWAAGRVAGLRLLRGGSAAGAAGEGPATGAAEVSAEEAGAPVLVVSQSTLHGDASHGRRPTWAAAAPAAQAQPLVERVVAVLRSRGVEVATGIFGAHMLVTSTGDGPVTLWLDSEERRSRA